MGSIAGYATCQVQENRRRVLVSWDWSAKHYITEVLQRVRNFIVRGIAGLPQTITLGEFFWR
jgi:hypothetical protein